MVYEERIGSRGRLELVFGWFGGEGVERSLETEEARRGGRAVPVKPKPGSVNYEIGRVVYGRGPMYAVPCLPVRSSANFTRTSYSLQTVSLKLRRQNKYRLPFPN